MGGAAVTLTFPHERSGEPSRPHCRIHLPVEMTAIQQRFTRRIAGAFWHKYSRTLYRCPVEGCHCVSCADTVLINEDRSGEML
jgi:hypothetical protein